MQTAEFQNEETVSEVKTTENGADQCTLFSFRQKEMTVHLGVSEVIYISQTHDLQLGRAPGDMLTKRDADFIYLTARFKNNFEVMSKVLSLITTAEQNLSGLKHQELSMTCLVPQSRRMNTDNNMHSEVSFAAAEPVQAEIFAEIFVREAQREAQFKSTGYDGPGLSLGLKTAQKTLSIDLPIFWVHHLKNGLKKALNWIQPTAGIRAG